MSIRNYDSTQTNHRKILSSPMVRKSNLKIINFFGREILNSGSGSKTRSKTHWQQTGVTACWDLIYLKNIKRFIRILIKPEELIFEVVFMI